MLGLAVLQRDVFDRSDLSDDADDVDGSCLMDFLLDFLEGHEVEAGCLDVALVNCLFDVGVHAKHDAVIVLDRGEFPVRHTNVSLRPNIHVAFLQDWEELINSL